VSLELLGGWHVAYCYYYCFDIEVFSPLLQSDEVGLAAHDVHVTTPPPFLTGATDASVARHFPSVETSSTGDLGIGPTS
jgi:hypothetical protein